RVGDRAEVAVEGPPRGGVVVGIDHEGRGSSGPLRVSREGGRPGGRNWASARGGWGGGAGGLRGRFAPPPVAVRGPGAGTRPWFRRARSRRCPERHGSPPARAAWPRPPCRF